MRIFKKESELELWMKKGDGYVLFATYPICRWSGNLGPKLTQGDLQSPEAFIRSHAPSSIPTASGTYHSISATQTSSTAPKNARVIFSWCMAGVVRSAVMPLPIRWSRRFGWIITKAFDAGQPRFHVHVMPFRWTRWNARIHDGDRWQDYWSDLRTGHDDFEVARLPPRVSVCKGRYVFEHGAADNDKHPPITERCPDDGKARRMR